MVPRLSHAKRVLKCGVKACDDLHFPKLKICPNISNGIWKPQVRRAAVRLLCFFMDDSLENLIKLRILLESLSGCVYNI